MAKRKRKSQAARAFSEDGALKTHVGGQALIEGIMMRGKYNWAVAVREPAGTVYIEEHDLAGGKRSWTRAPFLRGCVALADSMILSFKALQIAADHAYPEECEGGEGGEGGDASGDEPLRPASGTVSGDELFARSANSSSPSAASDGDGLFCYADAPQKSSSPSRTQPCAPPSPSQKKESPSWMWVSMVLGVLLGVAVFIVAPAFLTNLVVGEYDSAPVAWNIFDGLLRVAIFVFYLWLIGRMPDIKRMFAYHGAEHKTIHCFEHGLDLTPQNARSFPRLHVRCGTAFLIMVMIIAIIVYTVIPVQAIIASLGVPDGAPKLALVILIRILFLPVIAGISYEITVKWAGSRPQNPLVKVVLWPGMQMQYLTTAEPDDSQLECAIAAMQRVLAREKTEESKMQP